ncbi:MAG: hypothetical protein JRF27_06560, partial [Deltaproteobacteria bacterium]|nr:hypothetical protein [Deltaproteobacteria bacterium]
MNPVYLNTKELLINFHSRFRYLVVVCVLVLPLLTGCAALKVERKVENNIFYSSYPELKIRVSPEFIYLGNITPYLDGRSTDDSRELRNYFDNYLFIKQEDNIASQAIMIMFETIETRFVNDFWKDVEDKLASGKMTFGNETYAYYVKMVRPSKDSHIASFMLENGGYEMPACALMKTIGKIERLKENMLFQIMYLEAVTGAAFPCQAWGRIESLDDGQKKHLHRFD